MKTPHGGRRIFVATLLAAASVLLGGGYSLLGVCGPFSDVTDAQFCPYVLEIFTLGITTGTTPTTYDPTSPVSRLQMAAFLSRTVDGVLQRGSRRAALGQFSRTQSATALGLTTIGGSPVLARSDGADVWVAGSTGTVSRVRGSDGKLLETWTGAANGFGALVAMGRVFVSGASSPGKLYRLDPSQPAGAVTAVATNLGNLSRGITFDGSRIWTANAGTGNTGGSVSIITPGATLPWSVTTVTAGFTSLEGALYDGANVWVTDNNTGTLLKLDSTGAILQTVTINAGPKHPVFDGQNIWIPANNGRVSIVRASNGAVLPTVTDGSLGSGFSAAFDGQRVLVSHDDGSMLSVWKAANLTELGTLDPGQGTLPMGVCSDGVSFWIALGGTGQLARF